jgi:hypothetical protein
MLARLRRLPVLARMLVVMAAALVVMMALGCWPGVQHRRILGLHLGEAKWSGAMIVIFVPLIYILMTLLIHHSNLREEVA